MMPIDASRKDLVEEFRAHPIGRASGDLRRLLNTLRSHPELPPYVLVCMRPHREWRLAVKEPGRGTGVRLLEGPIFHDPLEAEWAVFKLRWQALTGEALD